MELHSLQVKKPSTMSPKLGCWAFAMSTADRPELPLCAPPRPSTCRDTASLVEDPPLPPPLPPQSSRA
uniref:Uncharacterized protein n=1 Tax=Anguilla anguilla TaxID=7936 RepID=A0A0E9T068_ANGAN